MNETDSSQNKNPRWSQNQIYLLIGLIVIVILVIIVSYRGKNKPNDISSDTNQNTEQNSEENPTSPSTPAPSTPSSETITAEQGNVTASGTLKPSDNPAKGNLMVENSQGKIYIFTQRDFSSLLGQSVTLTAQGNLQQFAFLGLSPANLDLGGASDAEHTPKPVATEVKFKGNLQISDQLSRGNYMIVSGPTKVYLKSVRDYSSWLGSDVLLSASGSLASFTNAILIKK
jgi:hypothetical protein